MTALPFELPAVVVLIGASGSGKTQAAAAFPSQWRLSLDECRRLVADDAGDQSATAAAVAVFDQILSGRLMRGLTTVVDATNSEAAVRASLLQRADQHRLPAVAITLRTRLDLCQARQHLRPANRQVPADTVTRQHTAVPTTAQLLAEGFAQVHDAADLDLLRLALVRAAAAKRDPRTTVRAAFGPGLTAVYAPSPSPDIDGAFVIADRKVAIRTVDGDAFQLGFQARLDEPCPDCGGPQWVRVDGPADLLDVYTGGQPDEPMCDRCG
ncbi:AAA family ATPase [Streptacidiphilus anmyonensis]|uniref:AAA family ATPase n=1 Tax=Streptacidiphilus anmyonensis TaxID=405782 RepID=UPI0005A6CCDE|nr:AAA family ATPase [Streptacidiphilus anmyonensis]